MKQKLSISIDGEKIKLIENLVELGKFRNKSHALEQGLDILLKSEEENNEQL
ncbi:MAG: hypothetical protein AABX66_01040 [Nanoarchaeota archaeon]